MIADLAVMVAAEPRVGPVVALLLVFAAVAALVSAVADVVRLGAYAARHAARGRRIS